MRRQHRFSQSPRGQGLATAVVVLFALAQVVLVAVAAFRQQANPALKVTPEEVVDLTPNPVEPVLPDADKATLSNDLFPPVAREGSSRHAGYAVPPPPPPMELVEGRLEREPTTISDGIDLDSKPAPAPEDSVRPISNREAVKRLELATVAETEGDVKGALTYLRAANVSEPNHPAILYRLGVLLHRLGSHQKAEVYFQIIRQMGEGKAGAYYPLAGHYLSGEDPDRRVRGLEDRPFRLGKAESSVTSGENGDRWITVAVSLRSSPGEEVNPGGVFMEILYYDLVNGRRAEQLAGEMQEAEWASETPDWIDPEEELVDLVFHVPPMSPGPEERSRTFFGFILKLYYEDEIQDVIADPRVLPEILANQQFAIEESVLDATLFGN